MTSSNSAIVRFEITKGREFMLDAPIPATPIRLSRWQQIVEYLKVLYR